MNLPEKVSEMCKKRKWSMTWAARGAYLHLESSELIESLRGKGGNTLHEAADVLIVLMSITQSNLINWENVLKQAEKTVEELMTKPHYKDEDYEK